MNSDVDLDRVAAGRPTLARPIGVLGRTWRRAQRRPALAAALLALAVVTATAIAIGALDHDASRLSCVKTESLAPVDS